MTIQFSKTTLFHEVTMKLVNIIEPTKYKVGIKKNFSKNVPNKYVTETFFDINKVSSHPPSATFPAPLLQKHILDG